MGQGQLRNGASWYMAIPEAMGHGLLEMGQNAPRRSGEPDDPSGRVGRWFSWPGPSAAQGVDGAQADTSVRPYRARNVRRYRGCPTRVQGFGDGGGLSNSVQLNLKTRENHPLLDGFSEHFGSRAASTAVGQRHLGNRTFVQGSNGAAVDSAAKRIGQLSSGVGQSRAGRLDAK